MTTLIDRILSQIIPAFVDYNLRTKKHIIEYWDTPETIQLAEDRLNIEKQLEYNLRQILEAELTAVKGVDELEAQLNQAQNNAEIWTAIWAIYDYLKQTAVASEECNIDLWIVSPTELDNLRKPIADYIKSKEKLTSLMWYIIDVCNEKWIRYLPVIPIHDRKITAYCDWCKKYVSVPHDCPSISSYQSS